MQIQETGFEQQRFNNYYDTLKRHRTRTSISPKDKNNLYADIKDFKQEFQDLKNTAEKLPDEYVDELCDLDQYPFDGVLDEIDDVEDWCDEVDEFLKDDIDNLYTGKNF